MSKKEVNDIIYDVFYDTHNNISPSVQIMSDEEYYEEDRIVRSEKLHYGSIHYEYRSFVHTDDPDKKRRHLHHVIQYTGHMYIFSPEANDRIIDYILSPTKQNARYLLMTFGIPIPLELLYRKLRQKEELDKEYSSSGGNDWAVPMTRRNFALCDFLHDLQNTNSNAQKESIHKRILQLSTLSTTNKLMVKTAFMNSDVNGAIKEIFMGDDSLWGRYEIPWKKETDSYILEKDREIIKQWQSWLDQGKATIMLDGVTNVAISDSISSQDLVKGLLQCAFIHLLVSNAVKIHLKSGTYTVKAHEKPDTKNIIPTIELLDGFMHRMDRVDLEDFYNSWVQSIQVDGRIANVKLSSVVSVQMHRFHNTGVKIDAVSQQVTIPIRNTIFQFPFTSKTFSIHNYHNKIKPEDRTAYIIQHYSIDKPKIFLNTLFTYIDDISDDLLEALVTANFLRDAVKTEVAIQNNAAFISIDQLAFVYYVMQCRSLNRVPKGFWLNENVLFYRKGNQTTRLSKR